MTPKNHEKENAVFERFVKNQKDVVAMIAYCLYRLEKIAWFKKNPNLDDQAKDHTCETLIAGNHFDRFQEAARNAIGASIDKAVADAVKKIRPKGFLQSICEGIVGGIITLILAPFLWALLYQLLLKLDWWNPFIIMINSFPKK